MAQERTQSKYAMKRAARFSKFTKTFKSLGEGPLASDFNPMPKPFDFDYFPKHTPKLGGGVETAPMKHENTGMLNRLRNRDFVYPKARFKKKDIVRAYNHEKMNYHGWNAT
jgi:hypothetical protein